MGISYKKAIIQDYFLYFKMQSFNKTVKGGGVNNS